ncbi:hypothetical protein G6M26_06575 [Agrobacterium tumefaciens]|nr:hypothetical protein [Agrobacterium tumefaciens]
MNKLKIVFFVIVSLILVILLFFYLSFPEKDEDVQFEVVNVYSKRLKSKLFIKKLIWGMTSDNCLITISNSNQKENEPDENKNYIYKGLSPFLYKISEDTLSVYVREISETPKNFSTRFKIIQTELDNSEMMELIENDNYKNKGLIKLN